MKRREFIALLAGAAAWPVAARAQQGDRVRRMGVLLGRDESDPEMKSRMSWLVQDLADLGWFDGRNMRLDIRFGAGDIGRIRQYAQELVDLKPDVLFVQTPAATRELQRRTTTIPIIFSAVGDPVAGGLLKSVSKPEGNATGATNYLPSLGGKWLELLKEAAPSVSRIALIYNPEISTGVYFAALEAAASQFRVAVMRAPYRDAADLVRAIDVFAAEPGGGIIVLPPAPIVGNRALINRLAVQHMLPAMHTDRSFVAEGGLMSYGIVGRDRRSASYVDRILRGAKPADLPVQFPTKFELVVNLKTAKATGLSLPESFLLRADELFE